MEDNPFEPQQVQSPPEHPKPRKCSVLLLAVIGSSLVVMVVGMSLYSYQQQVSSTVSSQNNRNPVPIPCLSPACMQAHRFSVNTDPLSRPCDYFLFTCGAEERSTTGRGRQRGKVLNLHDDMAQGRQKQKHTGGKARMDGETDKQQRKNTLSERLPDRRTSLLLAMREILELPPASVPADTAEGKARRFYHTCMDTQRAGAEFFLKLIQQLGGWAVSGGWSKPDFNSTLSVLMGQYNTFPFFSVYVGRDPNSSLSTPPRAFIQIDQPEFQFPVEWNSNTNKSKASTQALRAFLASCGQVLALLGVPVVGVGQHCGLYVSLSSRLAAATMPLQYRLQNQLLYHRVTIAELQTLAPAIDWLGCLQTTFHPIPLNQSEVVFLHNLPYLIHMSQTIHKWQREHAMMGSGPLHTYMILGLLQTLLPALESRFSETQKNHSIALGNTEEDDSPWRQCVLETEKGFDSVLSHVMRKNMIKKETEELVNDVFSAFKTKVADMIWHDEQSYISFLNKVRKLKPRLSTATESPSQLRLNEMYMEVDMKEDDYIANYLQLFHLQQKRQTRLLSHTPEPDILSFQLFVSGNDVIFPIGMFVPPRFHPSFPRAVNYGMLGFLMAKELLDLLLPDAQKQGETQGSVSTCVWSQFQRVTSRLGQGRTFPLSPSQHQEVWMQYFALQVALQAYDRSLQRHPGDTSLAGLSYTHLFLSSFIQVSCDSYQEFMPFEPSFLVKVICATPDLCPKSITCLGTSKQYTIQKC